MSDTRNVLVLRTATTRRKTWFPGWIWAIPLAAVGIVVWLMLRALSSRGFEVTLVLQNAAGMSANNTQLLYRGLEVGVVSDLRLAPDGHHITAQLDVDADMTPYVRSGSRFYVVGARPTLSDPSTLKAIISGPTIEFVPGPGKAARRFTAIEGEPPETLAVAVPYAVTFNGAVGGIEPGSPVTLGGFVVGEVASTQLTTDARTGQIGTHAVVRLDPTRFHIEGAAPKSEDWQALMTSTLAALVEHGLRASVTQTPPLIGDPQITLAMMPAAPPANLGTDGSYRAIPAIESPGLEAFSRKLGRMPIDEIGANVRAITERLKVLTASPQLDASIRHLDSTLAQLDRTVHAAGPQVAPTLRDVRATVASLQQTAAQIDATTAAARALISGSAAPPGGSVQQALQQLSDAARAIRSLADYLDRHPEALLRGR